MHVYTHMAMKPFPQSHLIWVCCLAAIIYLSCELFKEFLSLDPHPWLRGVYTHTPLALPPSSGHKAVLEAVAS